MSEEEAKATFAKTHEPPIGELSDEELENVAGGANCLTAKAVRSTDMCDSWACHRCGSPAKKIDPWMYCSGCGSPGGMVDYLVGANCSTCRNYEKKDDEKGYCTL